MKLHLNHPHLANQINAFSRKAERYEVKIGDATYKKSLILTPHEIEMWKVNHVDELTQADFEHLAKIETEVILLGTGDHCVFPNPLLTKPLIEKGIGLEVMDTAAACRTHSILTGDGRHVTAALILPS